jgi:hypothetical protein
MFPLHVGRSWIYQFGSLERYGASGVLRWTLSRTGTVRFSVLSESTVDTIKNWSVEAFDSLSCHRQDLYPYPGDTTYLFTKRDAIAIREILSGNHELVSDSCSPIWLFRRRWYCPTPQAVQPTGSSVYRYSSGPNTDTVLSTFSNYPFAGWDTLVIAADVGVTGGSSYFYRAPNNPYDFTWTANLLSGPTSVAPREGVHDLGAFALFPCFPNPFNPTTTIRYHVPFNLQVNISVRNVLGQVVSVLVDRIQNAGEYQALWDATGMPSGMYFCTMRAGGFVATTPMLLIK